jgi:hypothetical protein
MWKVSNSRRTHGQAARPQQQQQERFNLEMLRMLAMNFFDWTSQLDFVRLILQRK